MYKNVENIIGDIMKKLIILIFFLFCIIFLNVQKQDSKTVMGSNTTTNNYYQLDFSNELLNIRNFKLKLGIFTSYEYKINKVYIKYKENIKEYFYDKEYFSFDSHTLNSGIEKLKNEYITILKENHLYNELEKDMDELVIEKIDIFCEKEAIDIFKEKYPNVIIKNIS